MNKRYCLIILAILSVFLTSPAWAILAFPGVAAGVPGLSTVAINNGTNIVDIYVAAGQETVYVNNGFNEVLLNNGTNTITAYQAAGLYDVQIY